MSALERATNLTPRQLALIGAGGLALGLLWRRYGGGNTGGVAAGSVPYPDDYMNLGMDTVGGGAGGGGGGGGGDRRDVTNTVPNLPGVDWTFVDTDGTRWITDGETTKALGPANEYTPDGVRQPVYGSQEQRQQENQRMASVNIYDRNASAPGGVWVNDPSRYGYGTRPMWMRFTSGLTYVPYSSPT